jgi:hypothetical protein
MGHKIHFLLVAIYGDLMLLSRLLLLFFFGGRIFFILWSRFKVDTSNYIYSDLVVSGAFMPHLEKFC